MKVLFCKFMPRTRFWHWVFHKQIISRHKVERILYEFSIARMFQTKTVCMNLEADAIHVQCECVHSGTMLNEKLEHEH